ncbi:MAG: AAA family ATPase [Ignavibacteria bacterium]
MNILEIRNESNIYTGFKLISFELNGNTLFGDIKYEFIENEDKQDKIYTTVLIGQNGTLKSRLFQKIISLFWNLYDLKIGKEVKFQDKFSLKYAMNNSVYDFTNKSEMNTKSPILKKNGDEVINLKDAELPLSILAVSIMITDRYPFPNEELFNLYQYLGSRYRPQLASTKAFIGKVVELISNNIDSKTFVEGVRKIVNEFLQSSNKPFIVYNTKKSNLFFTGILKKEEFNSYFESINQKYENSMANAPFKLNNYNNIKKDKLIVEEIVRFCNQIYEINDWNELNKNSSKKIKFNLFEESDIIKLREQFKLLDHLRKLGIVDTPDIEFLRIKNDIKNINYEGYPIIESSSGEISLLGSLIGILASIKQNSLIFIDEPEISLHPNWQMKYLTILRELLCDKKYSTCHIIIATHSHFLISDLKGGNSKIIGLKNKNNKIEIIDFQKNINTFGWSAENVLLNVFDVATTRNFYIAEKLSQIFKIAAKSENPNLDEYKEELIEWHNQLTNNDPLHYAIEKLIEKMKWEN